MRRWAALLILVLCGGRAAADPPPGAGGEEASAAHAAALAVAAAAKGKDLGALRALANRQSLDPWMVVDELEGLGGLAAARAYGAEVQGPLGERLRKYLGGRAETPRRGVAREVLADARRFLADSKPESALRVLQALKPEDTRDSPLLEVRVRFALADAHRAYGELDKSGAELEAAGQGAERVGWLEAASVAFREGGQTAYDAYDYVAARRRWEGRLRVLQALGKSDEAGAVLNNIASASVNAGDLAAAIAYYRRAVDAFLRQGLELNAAQALQNLGEIEADLGQYARALSTEDRAWDLVEGVARKAPAGGEVQAVRAQISFTIAGLDLELGRTRDALERYRGVLETLGPDAEDGELVAMTYGNIGVGHVGLGEMDRAEKAYESALTYFEGHKDSERIAQSLANLADLLIRIGKGDKALRYQEAAIKRLEEIGNPLDLWHAKGELATYIRKQGDPAKALAGHLEALAAAESFGAKALVARQWSGIAGDKFAAGDYRGAAEAAGKAIEEMGGVVGGLADVEGISARETFSDVFVVGARAAARLADPAALALFMEAGRAGALLEAMGGREKMRSVAIPPALADVEQRARAVERDATAEWASAVTEGDRQRIADRRGPLNRARTAVRDVVMRIQREAKQGASLLYPRVDSLAQIAASLEETEALLLFSLFEDESFALVVRRSGPARIVRLPRAADIEGAVGTLLPTSGDPVSVEGVAALRRAVVEPLGIGPETRRVVVSADGVLANVPLALLFEDREVAFVPSGTVLRLLRGERLPQGRGVVGLGDPDYQSKSGSPRIQALRDSLALRRLKETRAEVETIADIRFVGDMATEAALRGAVPKDASRLRAVHLAGHGILDREQPLRSAIALTVDAEDDGLLTGLEVLRMRIPADAVVLSACRTGLGAIAKGEGITGLTRCFLFAGAPRVVASLWKVDDAATKELMVRFYEAWKPGKTSAAAALRGAQIAVRDLPGGRWAHPKYWAGWVVWGLPE